MAKDRSNTIFVRCANSRVLRKCRGAYLSQLRRIWNHLPTFIRLLPLGQAFGRRLHALVCLHADRQQAFSTFFLRNRAELALMRRLLDQKAHGCSVDIAVLACSKGSEVYSILWTIRSARPDLRLNMHAVDISQEILEFAENGVYSRNPNLLNALDNQDITEGEKVSYNTCRDQNAPLFERMNGEELEAMCELEGDQARVRSWLKEGIVWLCGDAGDPKLIDILGPQDVVVANRFLCHMEPAVAEMCLRNIARLVEPGGYIFVSGIDLDVRTRVAQGMGWKPVSDLMKEIHEGDVSLRRGWPLEYWGLEPFCDKRPDCRVRYASVFQVGQDSEISSNTATSSQGAASCPQRSSHSDTLT
ncbi:MAG: CheR family methyltransferase [Bryobacteraceae bacterium]